MKVIYLTLTSCSFPILYYTSIESNMERMWWTVERIFREKLKLDFWRFCPKKMSHVIAPLRHHPRPCIQFLGPRGPLRTPSFVRPSVRPRQKSKSPLKPYKSPQDHVRPLIWNIIAKRTMSFIKQRWQTQRQRQIQRQIQKLKIWIGHLQRALTNSAMGEGAKDTLSSEKWKYAKEKLTLHTSQ